MPKQSPKFERFTAKWNAAVDGGLIASAYVYRNEVTRRLVQGYTTGRYVTPHVGRSVTISPIRLDAGARVIHVGTNIDYAAFWEFGHHNKFTGKFERVEHWRLSMMDVGPQMGVAFSRTFKRLLST